MVNSGKTPFRFENMWLQTEGFSSLIKNYWDHFRWMGKPALQLPKKLKLVKELKKWIEEVFVMMSWLKNKTL